MWGFFFSFLFAQELGALVNGVPGVNAMQPVKVLRTGLERAALTKPMMFHVSTWHKQLNVGRNTVQVSQSINIQKLLYVTFELLWTIPITVCRYITSIHKQIKEIQLKSMKCKNPKFLPWHFISLNLDKFTEKKRFHTEILVEKTIRVTQNCVVHLIMFIRVQ